MWVLLVGTILVLLLFLHGIGEELSGNMEIGLRIVVVGLLHMLNPSVDMWGVFGLRGVL